MPSKGDIEMKEFTYASFKDTKFKADIRDLRRDESIKRRKWSENDDALLIEKFTEGLGISLIALILHRTEKAIMYRLQKLQLYPRKIK